MDRTLLDTDIYSEILKGRNQVVARRAADYENRFGQLIVSVITMAEIVKGIQKRGDVAEIDKFVLACDLMEVLLLDPHSAVIAGRIYGLLEKRGLSIDRADPLIAGIAIANDITLATGNIKHFQRIVDLGFPLRLVNWRDHDDG
ncbi:MAG: PIN domain-containing protein [Bythopirellula sp.]|nr:PIN domain-containing protein [Bythopirellula sp.]